MRKSFEVGKVSWMGESLLMPNVLMDKQSREAIGVNEADLVKVNRENKECYAIVHRQFAELIGIGKVTISSRVSVNLDAEVGDKVSINTIVTEDDKKEFKAELKRIQKLW